MARFAAIVAVLVTVQGAAQQFTSQLPTEHVHFSTFGGHPYFLLNPGHRLVLEGQDGEDQVELTITALNETKPITLPSGGKSRTIFARVVEEREVVNGSVSEVGRFWYARAIESGDVYFFGEEVDFYSGGVVVGTTRLWEAGTNGALPGLMMPGTFLLGARYYQNQAVAALDGAENLAMGLTIATPARTFSNCVQILETDTLRPESGTTRKTYAPGIGLINDDDTLLLTGFRLGTVGLPGGCAFVPFSDHPLFPLSPGRRLVLEGSESGTNIVLTITVLDEIRSILVTIAGEEKQVATRVIEERKTANGQLVEVARKFYAQCVETGDVYFFGKEADNYEGGAVIGHEGSWLTGVAGAEAGIMMPAHFTIGARYLQAATPGAGNYMASNSVLGFAMMVPAGTFTDCAQTLVTSSIATNDAPRQMTYAPLVGLISDHNVLRLTSFEDPNLVIGAPVLAVQDAVVLTWPFTDNLFLLQSSSNLLNWAPILQVPVRLDGRNQVFMPRDSRQLYFRLGIP